MPQSLMVSGGSSSGSSTKRQRSADSRDIRTGPNSAGPSKSNGSLSKPTVRIPNFLDKSKSEIAQAFQDLEWKQRFRLFHALEHRNTSPYYVDRSETVINRNRYGNVQPWDNARIKLNPPIGGSDYINASPITLRSRASKVKSDGATGDIVQRTSQENHYIATQGPKDGQDSHFWYMVMQETVGDVGVVVMLTPCYEANKEKCSRYFPANMGNPTILLSRESNGLDAADGEKQGNEETPSASSQDNISLKSISEDTQTGSQLRICNLTIENQSKEIHHYLFHGWPDFGKPEAEDRLALLELTRQSRKIAGESPVIVHCSAGVGRTGTFIALDFLTREIEEGRIPDTDPPPDALDEGPDTSTSTETWGKSGPPKVKTPTAEGFPSGEDNHQLKDDLIYETVNTLREQRMMMVMNELQYGFLYEVIREVFLEKYKARPEGAVVKSADVSADMPKAKVARVEEGEGDAEAGSGSEAETEIIEGGNEEKKGESEKNMEVEADPYSVVAPEQIRKDISQGQA